MLTSICVVSVRLQNAAVATILLKTVPALSSVGYLRFQLGVHSSKAHHVWRKQTSR